MNNIYFDFDIIGLKMCIFIFYCVSLFVYYGIDYNKCVCNILSQENIQNDDKSNISETNITKTENNKNNENTNISKQSPQIPYEEKYLSKVRNMINEYNFTQEEIDLESQKFLELMKNENKNIDEEAIKKQAREFVIDEQLKKFKNCFIIESTPLGSVLMFYNHNKLAFEYYSDLTIPYRFLETVARKYVLTYKYRPLYIDMEEELKEYERKLKEQEDALKEKEDMRLNDTNGSNEEHKDENSNKKNVFAKFKSYNKEAGTGRVNTAPAPKNNIPQNMMSAKLIDTKKNGDGKPEKMLLKERSNRYSYQGKFSNFNILQKIDKKKVNKKLSITFADFKKLNQSNKN